MSSTSDILREAMAAVDLHVALRTRVDQCLDSVGFDTKDRANLIWLSKNKPKHPGNPVLDWAWLDGFIVALHAGGQLPEQPDRVVLYRLVDARVADLVALALAHWDLSIPVRESVSTAAGVRAVAAVWAEGFYVGLERRQHRTRHRWTGRN